MLWVSKLKLTFPTFYQELGIECSSITSWSINNKQRHTSGKNCFVPSTNHQHHNRSKAKPTAMRKMTVMGTQQESQQNTWCHISWSLWIFRGKKKQTGSCIDMCYNPNFHTAWKRKKKEINRLAIYACIPQEQYFASTWSASNIIPLYVRSLKYKGYLNYKSFMKIRIFKFTMASLSFPCSVCKPHWCILSGVILAQSRVIKT